MSEAGTEPQERFATVGELELCYEELGDPGGEPMLLVMGLGTQLIHWHPRFCAMLGERGFRVIRFDNRDAGRSTKVNAPPPATIPMLFGLRRGWRGQVDPGEVAGAELSEPGLGRSDYLDARARPRPPDAGQAGHRY